jgi:hypothetical protein
MGMFDGLRQTDAEIAQKDPPTGFFAQMMASRGMPIGGRRAKRQQELVTKILNEEIEAGAGDNTSVNLTEVMPNAYFSAARRMAELGGTEESQKLYAAGMSALTATEKHRADLNLARAQAENLDEAPTEYLETLRKRDELALQLGKFAADSPTGVALQSRLTALNERLTLLNQRGATDGMPREIVLAGQFDKDRATTGEPGTAERIWDRERQTSSRAQDYAVYVRQAQAAGDTPVPFTQFTPEFQAQLTAGQESGGTVIKSLNADEKTAIDATSSISSIQASLNLMNEGLRMGPGADLRQWVARASATFLGDDPSAATTNTDAYIASSAPRVVEIVRALAPVTDQDKDYIQAAVGGNLNVATPEAMRKLLEIAYRSQTRKIENYNNRLSRLGPNYLSIAGAFDPIEVPQVDFTPPATPATAPGVAPQRVRIRVDANGNVVQ